MYLLKMKHFYKLNIMPIFVFYHVHAWYPCRPEEDVESPGMGVTDMPRQWCQHFLQVIHPEL